MAELLASSYVPYHIPLAYRRRGGSIECVVLTILRGTSIGIYRDEFLWESNVRLPQRIMSLQRRILERAGIEAGVVTYVDAPQSWVSMISHTIVGGTLLALSGGADPRDVERVLGEAARMLKMPLWILKVCMLRGLSYVRIVNGEVSEVMTVRLDPETRIVVGIDGATSIKELYREVYDDPRSLFKVLSNEAIRMEIRGARYIAYFTDRRGLRGAIRNALARLGSVEEIVVTQPDNIGLRIYRVVK